MLEDMGAAEAAAEEGRADQAEEGGGDLQRPAEGARLAAIVGEPTRIRP